MCNVVLNDAKVHKLALSKLVPQCEIDRLCMQVEIQKLTLAERQELLDFLKCLFE
jgi:hypothetical protein